MFRSSSPFTFAKPVYRPFGTANPLRGCNSDLAQYSNNSPTNPAFRAQPARRSLLEFQTTGRSREDKHSLSAEAELYPARRSSSASQVRRAPRQPSGEGGSTRTILMRLVGTGALLNRYLGLKPQAESYCRFFGAGNPSPIVFHDSRSAKKLQTLTSQKS
jgi:hypothetical protein